MRTSPLKYPKAIGTTYMGPMAFFIPYDGADPRNP